MAIAKVMSFFFIRIEDKSLMQRNRVKMDS
jgi:hypothetical protein